MIIVIVVDTFAGAKRGVPLAAVKLCKLLTEAGHEVRVVACGKSTSTYRVRQLWIPYLSFIAKWQGISYGRPDEDVLIKALEGADIVHLMLPFPLEKKAEFLARRFSVPVIASFGTTAHGFLNIIGIGWCTPASGIVYRILRFSLYKKCKNIICHSQQICNDLRKYKYPAKLHVIDESEFENISAVPKVMAAYSQAIADDEVTYADNSRQIFKRNWAVFPSSIDIAHPYKKHRLFFRAWYTLCYYFTVAIAAVGSFVLFGLKVEGKKNLRSVKGGAITVSNHVHNVDSAMLAASIFRKGKKSISIRKVLCGSTTPEYAPSKKEPFTWQSMQVFRSSRPCWYKDPAPVSGASSGKSHCLKWLSARQYMLIPHFQEPDKLRKCVTARTISCVRHWKRINSISIGRLNMNLRAPSRPPQQWPSSRYREQILSSRAP